jgi:hypothetical protein
MFRVFTLALGVFLLTLPRSAKAQAEPDSVKHRNNCRLAAQILATGEPAIHTQWALDQSWRCPETAEALSQRLRAAAGSRDTAALNAITAPAIELRDGRLFEAALAVASDQGATVEARIFAIRTLIHSMRPGGLITYDGLADREGDCYGGGPSVHQQITAGSPLPSDYVERVHTLGRQLMSNTAAPPSIRHAGMCAALAQELLIAPPRPAANEGARRRR